MSDLTLPFWTRLWPLTGPLSGPLETARTGPPKPPQRSPVFIHDAVTACQGETLLSLMLKQDLAALEHDDSTL